MTAPRPLRPLHRPHDHAGRAPRVPARAGAARASCRRPAWGEVKSEWRRESIGWLRRERRAGRRRAGALPPAAQGQALPRLPPRGPVIDWDADHLVRWLAPMTAHLAEPGRVRDPDGPAGGHPPLGRRLGQGRGRRRGGPAARRRARRPQREPPRRPGGRPAPRARVAAAGRRGRLRRRAAAVQLPDPAARRRRHAAHRGRRPQGHEPAVAPQHQEGRQGGRRHRARPGRRARAAS